CAGGVTGVEVGEMGVGFGEPGFGFTAAGCVGRGLTASVESDGMARSTVWALLSEQAASRTMIAGVVTKVERMLGCLVRRDGLESLKINGLREVFRAKPS